MIIPDVNLLVYAHNTDAPFHRTALAWWRDLLSSESAVGVPWAVVLGFVRLLSHPRVVERPLSPRLLLAEVRRWLELPQVCVLQAGPRHIELLEELLDQAGAAGDLTTDAHLAALAIEHHCILHSNDQDFARFSGLRWHNPLARR